MMKNLDVVALCCSDSSDAESSSDVSDYDEYVDGDSVTTSGVTLPNCPYNQYAKTEKP